MIDPIRMGKRYPSPLAIREPLASWGIASNFFVSDGSTSCGRGPDRGAHLYMQQLEKGWSDTCV